MSFTKLVLGVAVGILLSHVLAALAVVLLLASACSRVLDEDTPAASPWSALTSSATALAEKAKPDPSAERLARWAAIPPSEGIELQNGQWKIEILDTFQWNGLYHVASRITSNNAAPVPAKGDPPLLIPMRQVVDGVTIDVERVYGAAEVHPAGDWPDPDIIRPGDSRIDVVAFRARPSAATVDVLMTVGDGKDRSSQTLTWRPADFRVIE